MVSFEVFNRNRKWSDKDVTLLTLLGHSPLEKSGL